jgi:putative oxidoreductase
MTGTNFGLLVVRTIGVVFAAHGSQKLFGLWGGAGLEGQASGFHALGLRPARLHAIAAGVFEFGGGLLLAFGLATPVAALLITATMTTAVLLVHGPKGFFNAKGGFEFNLVLILAAAGIAATGPGSWSLDHAFGLSWHGVGWSIGAVTLGVLGGTMVVLSSRWARAREPTIDTAH